MKEKPRKGKKPNKNPEDERRIESRNMLKQTLSECFALYINTEAEKGDSWRDDTVSDLETLFYMKVHEFETSTANSKKAQILRGMIICALMMISKLEEN